MGRPLPGCSLRIAADGEVLIKGGPVFGGYWHDEASTRAVFDDEGWFRSGDVGEMRSTTTAFSPSPTARRT